MTRRLVSLPRSKKKKKPNDELEPARAKLAKRALAKQVSKELDEMLHEIDETLEENR